MVFSLTFYQADGVPGPFDVVKDMAGDVALGPELPDDAGMLADVGSRAGIGLAAFIVCLKDLEHGVCGLMTTPL